MISNKRAVLLPLFKLLHNSFLFSPDLVNSSCALQAAFKLRRLWRLKALKVGRAVRWIGATFAAFRKSYNFCKMAGRAFDASSCVELRESVARCLLLIREELKGTQCASADFGGAVSTRKPLANDFSIRACNWKSDSLSPLIVGHFNLYRSSPNDTPFDMRFPPFSLATSNNQNFESRHQHTSFGYLCTGSTAPMTKAAVKCTKDSLVIQKYLS